MAALLFGTPLLAALRGALLDVAPLTSTCCWLRFRAAAKRSSSGTRRTPARTACTKAAGYGPRTSAKVSSDLTDSPLAATEAASAPVTVAAASVPAAAPTSSDVVAGGTTPASHGCDSTPSIVMRALGSTVNMRNIKSFASAERARAAGYGKKRAAAVGSPKSPSGATLKSTFSPFRSTAVALAAAAASANSAAALAPPLASSASPNGPRQTAGSRASSS